MNVERRGKTVRKKMQMQMPSQNEAGRAIKEADGFTVTTPWGQRLQETWRLQQVPVSITSSRLVNGACKNSYVCNYTMTRSMTGGQPTTEHHSASYRSGGFASRHACGLLE